MAAAHEVDGFVQDDDVREDPFIAEFTRVLPDQQQRSAVCAVCQIISQRDECSIPDHIREHALGQLQQFLFQLLQLRAAEHLQAELVAPEAVAPGATSRECGRAQSGSSAAETALAAPNSTIVPQPGTRPAVLQLSPSAEGLLLSVFTLTGEWTRYSLQGL